MPPRNLAEVFGQSLSQFAVDFPRFAQLKQQEAQLQEQREFNRQTTLANLGLSEAAGGRAERGLGLQEERFGLEEQRFETERDAPPEPLTIDQQRARLFEQNPGLLERLVQAEVTAAERKGQPKPEKGPSIPSQISLGKEERQGGRRRLSGDIMEQLEDINPTLFDELIASKVLPSEDPVVLGSLARQFLTRTEDKPWWFTGDTTITETDPRLEAKLDTLGQVFSRPAQEFNAPLTAEDRAELKKLRALKAQQGNP